MNFLVSGLFFFAASLCILVGFYLLFCNIETALNKIAFLFCTSLSCWCFGAVQSLIASDYSDAMFWRRFAAIGVGTFFSFLLHYIIILTKREKGMKKSWMLILLYVPALLTVYFFALSDRVTNELYHLEETPIGWINRSRFNLWTVCFDVYIIGFLLTGLYFVYQWKRNSTEKEEKKQAEIIVFSYLISFVVAVLAELLDNMGSRGYFHEFAPLILILPMSSLCYAIRKHNFMKPFDINEDKGFMEQFRTKISKHLAGAFCIGGIIYFVSQYMKDINTEFRSVISFSIVLFLFGISVYVIQKYIRNKEIRIMLLSILISAAIPVVSLHFIQYASVTVWAFPFIILIATLLFNNATILTMVSVSMILTQLYIWLKMQDCVVEIRSDDYFSRIGFMGIGIFLVYYINKIYLIRLRQLSERIKTQDLLFLLSSYVINVKVSNFREKMEVVLHLLCEYINADRAHIYYKSMTDGLEYTEYYSWCNEASRLDEEVMKDTSLMRHTWWKNQLNEIGSVQIPNVFELKEEASHEKEYLLSQNIKSMIAVPLISHEQRIGFLRIDYVLNHKKWDDQFIKTLMIIGNILGEANIKSSSEKKMEQMAYYDQLTNIPNRQLFGERINQAIEMAGQRRTIFGVIFLNLDSFKIVNDAIGHYFGYQILVMIADKLTKCLRKTDTVCRFGGDEFLIMVNDITGMNDIETVVKKVIQQFEEPLIIGEQEFNITASVGISVYPMDGLDKDTLIKNADIAMYKAKDNGKNQFIFCSEEMKEEMQQTTILTNNLYRALEKDEFDILYQPQVSIKTGKVIAVEALVRWNHPKLGTISPAIFIPIAETTGLIISIGEWILKESCAQMRRWKDMGLPLIRLAVNVSVNQLLNSDFVKTVRNVLNDTGLESRYLELEITENIAMQESEYIIHVLSDLKALGVSLAIDDFGIDYSSLSRIKMLPIDRLKIDMHFIRGILKNEKDRVIVDVIIKLAKDLNLKVIAEGVEEEEQFDYLGQKMCDEVQGYYFYKPLPKKKMEDVLLHME